MLSPVFSGTECVPSSFLAIPALNLPWYVARTRRNYERILQNTCNSNAINTYIPWIHSRRQWNDRTVTITQSLLSGFIFIQPTDPEFHIIPKFVGFVNWLTFAGKPGIVHESELETLKRACCLQAVGSKSVGGMKFRPGERVLVESGPFAGHAGEVLGTNATHAKLLVQTSLARLGIGQLHISIPLADLRHDSASNKLASAS